ncbi:hypothetical protein LSAT2_006525, partial [Lamellibrachia satsuma]
MSPPVSCLCLGARSTDSPYRCLHAVVMSSCWESESRTNGIVRGRQRRLSVSLESFGDFVLFSPCPRDRWNVQVECTGGVYRWSIQVECTGGVYKWSVQVECTGGVYRWSVQVECTDGVYRWSVHM